MGTIDKEQIKKSVRDRYGRVASAGTHAFAAGTNATCCAPSDISEKTGAESSCGCNLKGLSVEQMSTAMGYSKEDLAIVPEGANMGLGCGNPVALASLKPGETVVDLGSGGGFDCFLAARQVGQTGRVIGVDMTPEMVSKARENAEGIEPDNVEFRLGEIEHLPVADNSVDIVMSNCVINLSPDKQSVYRDAFRVLKPGGRLAISDIVATAPVPEEVQNDLALLSACVGRAAQIKDIQAMLKDVGFQGIKIIPNNQSRDFIREWVPGKNIEEYIVAAYIEAVKPSDPRPET